MQAVGCSRRADRHDQFELQFLLHLRLADQHAAASEERIARRLDAIAEAERIGDAHGARHPALAKRLHLLWGADEHIFAHAERLEPVDVARRLAAETIAGDVEHQAVGGDRPGGGGQRIERIAGGRRKHEVAGRQRVGPILARDEAIDGGADFALAAAQASKRSRGDAGKLLR